MTKKIVQAITQNQTQQQTKAAPKSLFFATSKIDPSAFSMSVAGIENLTLPINEVDIDALLTMASHAHFGLREKTLLDKNVRDTLEIGAEQLQVNFDQNTLPKMLANMCADMGLPKTATLTPHLHNLLIYGPGQFFKPHQDSEKIDGMVATLIIVLPSAHIGGDLLINHGERTHLFSSENLQEKELQCIAFYADCEHEVKPIKQGYRVALTYNLVLEAAHTEDLDQGSRNPALEEALRAYFPISTNQTRVQNTTHGSTEEPELPKLVYYLDHSYTEHSLRWGLLKGLDGQTGAAFRGAAQKLGLVPHLALAEIHQTWSTEDDSDDPEPIDLIDDELVLDYWVNSENKTIALRDTRISVDQIAWSKEIDEDNLVRTESEGWTGNAGNTVDYWYRRSAIVLWRETDDIAMNFKIGYEQALSALCALSLAKKNKPEVLKTIQNAGNFLHRTARYGDTTNDFSAFLPIALSVENEAIAQILLQPFSLGHLDLANIENWVRLQNAYGINWCQSLIGTWSTNQAPFTSPKTSPTNIHTLIQNFIDLGGEHDLATAMLQFYLNSLDKKLNAYHSNNALEKQKALNERITQLANVLRASSVVRNAPQSRSIIAHVMDNQGRYPAFELVELVLALHQETLDSHIAGYEQLKTYVAESIANEFNAGLRAGDDNSIVAERLCGCEYCIVVYDFAASKTQTTKIWPLSASYRDHIINSFRAQGLPLSFEVKKLGSPHKLYIIKGDQIYVNAQARYLKLGEYHASLTATQKKPS